MKSTRWFVGIVIIVLLMVVTSARAESRVFPAPPAEYLSKAFSVRVDGHDSPVYLAKVGAADDTRRWLAMDVLARSSETFDPAGFSAFEIDGSAEVTVTSPEEIHSAVVVPASAGITPRIDGRILHFTVKKPGNLTVEINGDYVHSLHLFANPIDRNPPSPNDPNVMYFGPGVHDVPGSIDVPGNKTVYLAGGAIVRGIGKGEPVFAVRGNHVKILGSGVVDGGSCPIHSRYLMVVRGNDITIQGIILNDSPGWNMPIRQCDGVLVQNVKIIGHRANSDGIDICNSRNVTVDGCFVRTLDDLVVIKSDEFQGIVHHVIVKNCTLWNEVAHALSIGAELRENVDDVLFTDCEVIHDTGREWTLRVYHCDSAIISNVRFQNLKIDQSRRLISLWIGKAQWTRQSDRGHIKDVTFTDIDADGTPMTVALQGFDAGHAVEGVTFKNVRLAGEPLKLKNVQSNAFVSGVGITP